MDDDKLAIEEARRAGQHGSVKSQAEGEVQAELAEQSAQVPPSGSERIGQLAHEFRAKAVDEVVETEREVERARGVARVSQIVDYIFYVIYGLLGLRFLLSWRSQTLFTGLFVELSPARARTAATLLWCR